MKSRIRLRKSSTKVYRRLQDGPVLPPWVRAVPYLLGLIVFVFVSLQLFAENESSISSIEQARLDSELARSGGLVVTAPSAETSQSSLDQASPDQASATTAPTDPTAPIISGSSTDTPIAETETAETIPTTTPESELSVGIPTKTGLVVQVPSEALAMARTATVARFTGDFEAVELGSAVSIPWLPRTWTDPYVGDPVVSSVGDGVFILAFRVDPDRSGVEPLREILTAVSYVPGQGWVWLGV